LIIRAEVGGVSGLCCHSNRVAWELVKEASNISRISFGIMLTFLLIYQSNFIVKPAIDCYLALELIVDLLIQMNWILFWL